MIAMPTRSAQPRVRREPARCTAMRDRRRHGLIYRGICDRVLDERGHCPDAAHK